MLLVCRRALSWRAVPYLVVTRAGAGVECGGVGAGSRRGVVVPGHELSFISHTPVMQRRPHTTAGGSGDGNSNTTTAEKSTDAPSSSSPGVSQEAMGNLLDEIQVVLSRPVPIGSLFRALSPTSRKTLVQNKEPLEQLLLRYPEHFAVYQQGNVRNRVIYCAPPHLVPAQARRMSLEKQTEATVMASTSSSTSNSLSLSSSSPRSTSDINERVLQLDHFAERQRRINTVLQYIPNEWSPFTELGIPEEVRVRCMGKPAVKAIHYFEKYPQYFEVRQQGLADHTFYVRRSLALQRSLEKPS